MSDLSFHVRQFVPACADGEEMAARSALLSARDYAARLRGTARSGTAYDHAIAAHDMAGEFVFADVPVDRLKLAVAYCRNMVQAALIADNMALLGAISDD